jgi:hypothetical protein
MLLLLCSLCKPTFKSILMESILIRSQHYVNISTNLSPIALLSKLEFICLLCLGLSSIENGCYTPKHYDIHEKYTRVKWYVWSHSPYILCDCCSIFVLYPTNTNYLQVRYKCEEAI